MRSAALYLSSSVTAREDVAAALERGQQVFVSGLEVPGARKVAEGWGAAVREALSLTHAEVLAVQVPSDAMESLIDPILQDHADVVTGHRVTLTVHRSCEPRHGARGTSQLVLIGPPSGSTTSHSIRQAAKSIARPVSTSVCGPALNVLSG